MEFHWRSHRSVSKPCIGNSEGSEVQYICRRRPTVAYDDQSWRPVDSQIWRREYMVYMEQLHRVRKNLGLNKQSDKITAVVCSSTTIKTYRGEIRKTILYSNYSFTRRRLTCIPFWSKSRFRYRHGRMCRWLPECWIKSSFFNIKRHRTQFIWDATVYFTSVNRLVCCFWYNSMGPLNEKKSPVYSMDRTWAEFWTRLTIRLPPWVILNSVCSANNAVNC